ncbi:MAG: lysylphosphatidylglycerol synthase transmembrane domain-containing protein [Bacteroidales bacterium]|nr:lysylphosphatidylglycerol synthase transmembrane domain-containing protein [Bacteroidales bacterium]
MNKTVKNIIKITLFVITGAFLFFLVYKDFDFSELFAGLKNLNYWWFLLMFVIGILSHVSRTLRWQMLLESNGEKTRFLNTFFAVMNGYFANIAVPRLGEVTRCAVVSKYDKVNFSKVLGTMVTERIIDVIMLLLITSVAIILQSNEINQFLVNNPDFGKKFEFLLSLPFILGTILIGVFSIIFIIRIAKGKYDHIKFLKKLSAFINNFWIGIISLKNVKRPLIFILHSIFIWTMYFLMMYVCFFAFDGFESLTIVSALMLFVAGSFGMVAPAPNGIGAYHFMIIQALMIYGIPQNDAAGFAFIVHSLQTAGLIIMGVISFIFIPIINKNR